MTTTGTFKNKGRGKLLALLLVLVVAGSSGGYWYWDQGKKNSEQEAPLLATVRMGSIENTISATGRLKPSNFVDVGAQVSGQLQKLHVEVGDVVDAGQLLAEIDARVQEERVNSSRAGLAGQKAQLEARRSALDLAQINAERQKGLRDENATSQLEYDSAMNNLAAAEAAMIQQERQIEQSQASLTSDETQLEFTKIFAPVAGTITSIAMNEGRTLNATQQAPTILQIADLDTMTVETEISEADVSKVKKGMDVYFTTLGNGNRRWYGNLRQILPTPVVTNNVVLYTGLFDIENSDAVLLPEMTTQVYFVSSAASNVLVVPMGSLSFINDAPADNSAGDVTATAGSGGMDAERMREMAANGQMPEVTPEMRERFRQMRESGAMPQGGPGAGGAGGEGFAAAMATSQQPGAGQPGQRSRAKVTVMLASGKKEEREVLIGLTSRINAEVISGLKAGDEVIAGIAQAALPSSAAANNNNFRPPFMRF